MRSLQKSASDHASVRNHFPTERYLQDHDTYKQAGAGPAFMRAWARLAPAFGAVFAAGGAVGMCCHHGAGRSGVVAAMHLIDAGQAPEHAVRHLRDQFPETVENEKQHDWLIRYAMTLQNTSVS